MTDCVVFPAWRRGLAAVCACLASASAAPAQMLEEPTTEIHRLSLNASMTGGYDGNVFIESIGVADPRFREGGAFTGASIDTAFSRRGDRLEVTGSTGGSFRFYGTADRHLAGAYNGTGSISVQATRRLRLKASGMGNYSPYYFTAAVPTRVSENLVQIDYRVIPRKLLSGQGTASVNYRFGRYSTLDLEYSRSNNDFAGPELDMATTSFGGRFTKGVSRYGALRLGYTQLSGAIGAARLDPAARVVSRTIDAGLDFARALPVSDRTTFTFNAGASAIEDGHQTRYEPTGHASLTRRVSDALAVKLEYRRSLTFMEGFRDAYFSDSVILGALSRLSRSVTLRGQVAYVNGRLGFLDASPNLDTYSATSRLAWRFSETLSWFGELAYYRYQFGKDQRIAGFGAAMDRPYARIGIELAIPLVRERNTRAPR